MLLSILLLFLCDIIIVEAKEIQLYGLNYSPRNGPDWAPDSQKCKSIQNIRKDLKVLKSLTNRIRIYSMVDCNQAELVLKVVKEENMKLWMGLWVSDNPNVFEDEKAKLLSMIENNLIDPEVVVGISVGSEAIYREEISAAESIENMKSIKKLLSDSFLSSIPVTIVDITDTYEANPSLYSNVDIITGNQFPFWENINVGEAVPYLINELDEKLSVPQAKNKKFILTETGWSSGGDHEDASVASGENQAFYFQKFFCSFLTKKPDWGYYYFSGLDNDWRIEQEGDENTVEGRFGIYNGQRELKPDFRALEFCCNGELYTMPGVKPSILEPKSCVGIEDNTDDFAPNSSGSSSESDSDDNFNNLANLKSIPCTSIKLLLILVITFQLFY